MAKIVKVHEVAIDELKPYERNAKIHGERQLQKIADIIFEFGFISPCIIDEDFNLIAGHGRVEAAKRLGMEKVPCVFIEGLTEEQKRAYILADNKLAELSEWDSSILNMELGALEALDFDISLTGFEFEEPADVEIDDEEEPELQFTEVLGEEHNYIVLYFDTDVDWLQAETLFDIKPMKNLLTNKEGRESKSMQRVSVGRVLNGADALEKLRRHYENID